MFYKGNEKYNKLFCIYILNNLLILLYYPNDFIKDGGADPFA